MSKWTPVALLGVSLLMASTSFAADKPAEALNFKMKSLAGDEVDLSQYQGKVVLVVNTASKCGLTPQYEGLQALHEKYGKTGLSVLGFPCNQFGKQEPGDAHEISEFCTKNYGVTFDMFAKVDVNGDDACPLYKLLTATEAKPEGAGPVKWNFGKFLIGRDGTVVARFAPKTAPAAPEVIQAIEAELAKK